MNRPRGEVQEGKRQPPLPINTTLPADIFALIVQWVYAPKTLAVLTGVCSGFRQAVLALPPWHSSCLKGGTMFRGAAVPIQRALRLLIHRRCEVCHKNTVHGFKERPFSLFAHEACVSEALVNTYYLTSNQLPRMRAAQAPIVTKEGGGGWQGYPLSGTAWQADYYWKEAHPALDRAVTLSTVEGMTLHEAAAAGELYRYTRARNDSMALPLFHAELAHEARLTAEKAALSETRQQRRITALAAALQAAAMPTLHQLAACYGEVLLRSKPYLGAYLSRRLTAPYSVAAALERVRFMAATEKTLAQRYAEVAVARARMW